MLTYFRALFECISVVSRRTTACWDVVEDSTLGIDAAGSRAGVFTFLLYAGQVVGALRVDETLRSAAHIGVSNVVLDTPAGPGSIPGAALSIGSTRRGVAGVDDLGPGDDLR